MIKWQWFIGGKKMFWLSIVMFCLLIEGFILTYVIDPTTLMFAKVQKMNSASIEKVSTEYIKSLGITIDKPIVYRFVRYRQNNENSDKELLGSFHEWNNTYYIDISIDVYNMIPFEAVVVHETRHMVVLYLKEKHVIDLYKYTEEIAEEQNIYYNNLFKSGVELLKSQQSLNKK
jgi:hypothetical protein